jgi:hypothetical protein
MAMPLSFFHHQTLSHYCEDSNSPNKFGHTFGGDPSSFGLRFANCEPLHLVYRLNQADPAVNARIPGVTWLPLIYHFPYASIYSDLVYRLVSDTEIEMLAPLTAEFDDEFPYSAYPSAFPESPVAFSKRKYDPALAEDAVPLAGVFGIGQLSDSEMKKAVQIVGRTSTLFEDWAADGGTPGVDFPDWSEEELVRHVYDEPFMQRRPTKECDNPECTPQVSRDEKTENLRKDSMRVFALLQPDAQNKLLWGHLHAQLIWQLCESCNCIRVSYQCT